jgi:hypothetical protein
LTRPSARSQVRAAELKNLVVFRKRHSRLTSHETCLTTVFISDDEMNDNDVSDMILFKKVQSVVVQILRKHRSTAHDPSSYYSQTYGAITEKPRSTSPTKDSTPSDDRRDGSLEWHWHGHGLCANSLGWLVQVALVAVHPSPLCVKKGNS